MNDLPTTREELERKTIEVLSELAHKQGERRLTKAELGFAGKVLWQVTAGLVDSSVSDLCSAVAEQVTESQIRQALVSAKNVLVFAWYPEKNDYTVEMFAHSASKPMSTRHCKCEWDERNERLESFFNTLESQGYRRY